jgi:NADH-quinone oxidoreductase subunit N
VQASQAGTGSLGLLAVLAVLNAAAAAFYYLRVVVYMFMRDPTSDEPRATHGRLLWTGLAAATILTIVLGLVPGPLLDAVGHAARALG